MSNILLVEDNELNRDSVVNALRGRQAVDIALTTPAMEGGERKTGDAGYDTKHLNSPRLWGKMVGFRKGNS